MKTIKIILTAIVACIFSVNAVAQCHTAGMDKTASQSKSSNQLKSVSNLETAQIHVYGNCEICKARIEKATMAVGASNAEWNAEKQMLTVCFNAKKTSVDKINKALAKVGHDTDKYKADDKTYNALPSCCKYERKK